MTVPPAESNPPAGPAASWHGCCFASAAPIAAAATAAVVAAAAASASPFAAAKLVLISVKVSLYIPNKDG